MRIRPNTWDNRIIERVLVKNEYGLPPDMSGMTIMDIGAHIGAFTVACQKRGAAKVISYEPETENFELLKFNVNDPQYAATDVIIVNAAVLGVASEECGIRKLKDHDFDQENNTGHVDIFGAPDNTWVHSFEEATADYNKIDLLKLDCEGAEWSILECPMTKVGRIVAELHAVNTPHPVMARYTGRPLRELADEVIKRLGDQGFEVVILYNSEETANLAASRMKKVTVEKQSRILWVGDANVNTGYGRVTEKVCNGLYAKGWDVRVLGMGYNGDPHGQPYKIYPANSHKPLERIPELVRGLKPAAIILQDDSWNVGIIGDSMAMSGVWAPTIGYIAVDSGNVRQDVALQLKNLKHAICHTQFGLDELYEAGYTGRSSFVEHGVDTELYKPIPRDEARLHIDKGVKGGINNAFIWGVVAANQPRKRLDLTMAYFAKWWNNAGKPDNVYLYLHTGTAEQGVYDIKQLATFLGIRGRVLATEDGQMLSERTMPMLYNSFDVLLSTSEGESFGLPHAEAAACGIPQIAIRCSGLASWAADAIYWVEPSAYTFSGFYSPVPLKINSKRWLASEKDYVAAMTNMYENKDLRDEYAQRGLQLAKSMTWEKCINHFDDVLRQVLKTQQVAQAASTNALAEF